MVMRNGSYGREVEDNGEPAYNGDGNLKVYIPDGHIWTGGFREIWKATRLPCPPEHGGDNRKYVEVLDESELRKLGYPKDGVNKITIAVRRPHNIPDSIKRGGGIGVSGKDFFVDKLGIDSYASEDAFRRSLEEMGMTVMLDIGSGPSYIVIAFPWDYLIRNRGEIGEKVRRKPPVGRPIMATEFENMTRNILDDLQIGEYELIITDGKTETFPLVGDSHGMLDVTETGNSLRSNRLVIAEPMVIEKGTPHLVADTATYRNHMPVIDEMVKRMELRKEELMDESPDIFAGKLSTAGIMHRR